VKVVAVSGPAVDTHRVLSDEEHVPPAAELVSIQNQVVPDREGKVVNHNLGHNLSFLSCCRCGDLTDPEERSVVMTSLEPKLFDHTGPKDLDLSGPEHPVVVELTPLRLDECPTHLTEIAAGLLECLNGEVISVNRVHALLLTW